MKMGLKPTRKKALFEQDQIWFQHYTYRWFPQLPHRLYFHPCSVSRPARVYLLLFHWFQYQDTRMIRLHIHLHHDNRHLAHHENLNTTEFFTIIIKNYVCYSSLFMHKLASMHRSHRIITHFWWFCADVREDDRGGINNSSKNKSKGERVDSRFIVHIEAPGYRLRVS